MICTLYTFTQTAPRDAEWNCSQWRNLSPADGANSKPELGLSMKLVHVSGALQYLNPAVQDLFARADVIVFQRNLVMQRAYDVLNYWRGMGKPVLVDLDDAYHILPWSNPAHRFWHEMEGGKAVKMLEDGLRLSDGLVAPNRLLLYDWQHVADGYYLPNFADRKFWSDLPTREEAKAEMGLDGRIVIGWGGSVSHYDSWWGSGIFEAAKRISARHPEVLWMICGNDFRICEQLPVPDDQKYLQEGVHPSLWPAIIKRFDIGVAPLFGPYDMRRSWIKGLEYLLAGVPWIATRGEPYADLKHLGTLVDNEVDVWEFYLEEKIKHLEDEQEIARERMSVAEQWFADNQIETMKSVYGEAIKNFTGVGPRLPGVYYVKGESDERESA